jgi:hypothetical protein
MFASGSAGNNGAEVGDKICRAHSEDEPWLKRGFNVRCHVFELLVGEGVQYLEEK